MRTVLSVPLAIIAFSFGCLFPPPATHAREGGEWRLSGSEERRLRARSVVVRVEQTGGSNGIIRAAIDISAARDVVWRVMLDCARAPRFIEVLERCEILKTEAANVDVRRHVVRWAWFLPEIESVFRSRYDPPETIRFEKIGGDLDQLEGVWRLSTLGDGRTRVHYLVHVGVTSFLPTGLVLDAIERDVPKTLLALRNEVEREAQRR